MSALTRTTNPPLFGVDLETVVSTYTRRVLDCRVVQIAVVKQVNREVKTGGIPGGVPTSLASGVMQVPLILKRCVEEIERRGLDIIGKQVAFCADELKEAHNLVCRRFV